VDRSKSIPPEIREGTIEHLKKKSEEMSRAFLKGVMRTPAIDYLIFFPDFESARNFDKLPESDLLHLANDVKRVYGLLTRQWLDYLLHLKVQYPYLFSLALRTNPYVENPSVIVE